MYLYYSRIWRKSDRVLSCAGSTRANRPRARRSCGVTWSTPRSRTCATCSPCRRPPDSAFRSCSSWRWCACTCAKPTTFSKVSRGVPVAASSLRRLWYTLVLSATAFRPTPLCIYMIDDVLRRGRERWLSNLSSQKVRRARLMWVL